MPSARIDTSGAYVGKFTHARGIIASTGTEGIEFSFISNSGQAADRLTIYTYKSSGEAIEIGQHILNGIMTVLSLREIKPSRAMVNIWDNDAGQRVNTECDVYPALAGKPIGVLIQMEEYESNGGEPRLRTVLWDVFDPVTRRVASEILAKKPDAEAIEGMIARLMANPIKRKAKGKVESWQGKFQPLSDSGKPADMTDDIPF